jgi:4-amino-4-deoxy-L-arabinose transferase-like glycosyltransferase
MNVATDVPAMAMATARPQGRGDSAARRWRVTPLVVLLGAGAVVRLLFWYSFRAEPLNVWDERDYHALAANLLEHGEYTFTPGGTPTSLRPPLFPAVVAGIYAVAGAGNYAAVRLVLAVLSLLTVVVTYRLGRAVATPRVALWAAGLLCFYPSLLAYNNLLLAEVPFTFLLTTSCLLVVRAIQRGSVGLAVAAGGMLGLAALTRSVVWLAPPFLAGFLAIVWPTGRVRGLAAGAALVAAFAVTIAPWSVRNTRLQETFVAIDVMGGRNFMMGNYRHTPLYRSWDAISIEGDRAWDHEVCATYRRDMRTSQGKVDKLAMTLGLKFARENPGLTLQRCVVKFFDFWGLEREVSAGAGRGFFGQISKVALLGLMVLTAGAYAATIFLAFFGLVFAPPSDSRGHWLFVCVIVFVCGLHTIVFGHSRYHLPLIPLVLLYTAGALTQARAIWARRCSPRFALAVALCAGLLAGWTWNFIAVDWQLFMDALRSMA